MAFRILSVVIVATAVLMSYNRIFPTDSFHQVDPSFEIDKSNCDIGDSFFLTLALESDRPEKVKFDQNFSNLKLHLKLDNIRLDNEKEALDSRQIKSYVVDGREEFRFEVFTSYEGNKVVLKISEMEYETSFDRQFIEKYKFDKLSFSATLHPTRKHMLDSDLTNVVSATILLN